MSTDSLPERDQSPYGDPRIAGALNRHLDRRGLLDRRWIAPVCFGLTVLAVFWVGLDQGVSYYAALANVTRLKDLPAWNEPRVLLQAFVYTAALLGILTTHEMGHWVVSKLHGVKTSLPVFIPMPFGIGTFGAVIAMRQLPPDRKTLLRIGAAGPLAGGVVALVLMAVAIRFCPIVPSPGEGEGGLLFGDSIMTLLLQRVFFPGVPPGSDLLASPLFFAAWAGFLLTSINLMPIGQLDGGHVAYALFGERMNRIARPLALVVIALAIPSTIGWSRILGGQDAPGFSPAYIVWGLLCLTVISWHPPVPDPERRLGPLDRVLAVACLILFALTFMPTPMRIVF